MLSPPSAEIFRHSAVRSDKIEGDPGSIPRKDQNRFSPFLAETDPGSSPSKREVFLSFLGFFLGGDPPQGLRAASPPAVALVDSAKTRDFLR